MGDFTECLANALSEGVLSEQEHDALRETYSRVRSEREAAGSATADNDAGLAVMAELEYAKKRTAFLNALNKQTAMRLERDLERFRSGSGQKDVGEFLQAVIEFQGQGTGLTASVEGRRQAILGNAMSRMEALIHEFRQGTAGRRVNAAKMPNIVRELFGQDTKDESAKALAKSFSSVAEDLRQRANAAGMDIAKLENWGLPQQHNRLALRNYIKKHGREEFKQHLFGLLAPERMIDQATGSAMTRGQVFDALDDVIDNILTDGWATREPQRGPFGRGSLANQRQEHRFLVFKDADAWLSYQKEFGSGDPFNAMMGHVDAMARDIAALEVLGPNPEATRDWLRQHAEVQAANHELGRDHLLHPRVKNARTHVRTKIRRADEMWAHYSGSANVPVNESLAVIGGNTRNFLTSSILGSAAIPSFFTDPMYGALARYFTGSRHSTWMKEWIKQFTSRASRRDAQRMGLILDSSLNTLGQQARYAGQFGGQAWSRVLAEQMLAITGLQSITRAGRNAFSMGLFADLADRKTKAFDQLPGMIQRSFQRYDISPDDWDAMRGANAANGFLDVRTVEAHAGRDLAEKLLTLVQSESEYAVPSGTLRARSFLIGDSRTGTWIGEVRRSATMFMSFASVLPMLHGYRILQEVNRGSAVRGVGYATALMLTMTVGGALSMQSKQLAAGRDPREMYGDQGLEFWGAAALQGGGLGLFGDFFFADVNRFGGSLPGTAGGPVVQLGSDILGILQNAVTDPSEVDDDLTELISRKMPGSNTWYLKLAWDRYVEDTLTRLTDPDAEAKFRRRVRQYERDYGQGYWWAPGTTAPQRDPDYENVVEG